MNQSVDNAIGGYEDGHLVNVRDSALSPCPFCGGSNLRKGSSVAGHGESTPYIECKDCDARVSDWYGNPIKKWNTRAPGIAMQDAFEKVFGKEPEQQTLQDAVNRRSAYNGFQVAHAKYSTLQEAFEHVCEALRFYAEEWRWKSAGDGTSRVVAWPNDILIEDVGDKAKLALAKAALSLAAPFRKTGV